MIEFRNVSKIYNNGTEALHNINLNVEKGEFVFIVGSSGAGKSTFLKMIMCEEKPNKGQIIIDGQDVSHLRKGKIPFVRRKMGIVFQDFRLIDHMTVYDNVAFAMRVVGASRQSIKKRVPYILGLVGLQHKAKHLPTELSGGEKQRVGLARALVNNPSMIVADEPTGNIDPALSFEIVDLLSEINRRGTTVLMVTHEHSLVKHFHKRIIQIHSGEIVADTGEVEIHSEEDCADSVDADNFENTEEQYNDNEQLSADSAEEGLTQTIDNANVYDAGDYDYDDYDDYDDTDEEYVPQEINSKPNADLSSVKDEEGIKSETWARFAKIEEETAAEIEPQIKPSMKTEKVYDDLSPKELEISEEKTASQTSSVDINDESPIVPEAYIDDDFDDE